MATSDPWHAGRELGDALALTLLPLEPKSRGDVRGGTCCGSHSPMAGLVRSISPPHRASLGAHVSPGSPHTQGRDRVTLVPTHTEQRWGSHVSPHSPGCLTHTPPPPPPPQYLLFLVPQFPQISFPLPRTHYTEGHCHCWCPHVLTMPHHPQSTGSTHPRTHPSPPWGSHGVGTHLLCPALPCLSFPTSHAL